MNTIHSILHTHQIKNIHFHSANIQRGDLFVAIPGTANDGHAYINQAIEQGAVVIVGEKNMTCAELTVPYYRVKNARLALAQLTAEYYNHPAQYLEMIGITGTNGKTTTAFMLHHILRVAGIKSSLIGTIMNLINGHKTIAKQTTPDALELQQLLSESQDNTVIMEVSSHALDQHRVSGVSFDYALFTNLSHDHLDYHKNMETYFKAKAKLFEHLKPNGTALINSEDVWGKQLLEELRTQQKNIYTFGRESTDHLQLINWKKGWPSVLTMRDNLKNGNPMYEIALPLPGLHNIWNALGAFLTAKLMGIKTSLIIKALQSFPGLPGRLEKYDHPSGAKFIIDYAHTPDGLEHSLRTLKECGAERLTHILSFRAKRDLKKRKIMTQITADYCDRMILTMDDYYPAEATHMFEQMQHLASAHKQGKCIIMEDRTKAIQLAWKNAQPEDWVLITGKGPEPYQHEWALPALSDSETIQFLQKSL